MANIESELAKRIEQVIRTFLVETRAAAVTAVEAGFGAKTPTVARKQGAVKRPAAPARDPARIDAIRDRFLEAVRSRPGETMETLAGEVGEKSAVVYRYTARLKERGVIRTVGKLRDMRYFPTAKLAPGPVSA